MEREMTAMRTESGTYIKGFDEAYASAVVDGVNEEAGRELHLIGYVLGDFNRVISLYFRGDLTTVTSFDIHFNPGYTIDQYIELVLDAIDSGNCRRYHADK
jgi:hypothetical protein